MKKVLNPNYGISPAPVAMVSSGDYESSNIATISWTGILNSEPMIIYISVRKSRYTHEIISKNKEFVVNLPDEKLVKQADFCGTKSGKEIDKFEVCKLTKGKSSKVNVPYIEECPISLECKLREIKEYPSHDVFIADVVSVIASEEILDEQGKIDFEKANLITYVGQKYFANNEKVGFRGIGLEK